MRGVTNGSLFNKGNEKKKQRTKKFVSVWTRHGITFMFKTRYGEAPISLHYHPLFFGTFISFLQQIGVPNSDSKNASAYLLFPHTK